MNYTKIPSDETIAKTAAALKTNGIEAFVVDNARAAKAKVVELIPAGAEVMNMTSVTLDTANVATEVLETGRFSAVRNRLNQMDDTTQGREKRQLGAAPDWVIGSVHAVTQDGHALIASNSGSQLPAYAYGAAHVIWVVGAQKIVKDVKAGIKRIYEHSLPLESERARKAYGVPGSAVNKILIVNKEVQPGRITMVLVKEPLGF